jgi:hypothetical protein
VRAPYGEIGRGATASPWSLPICALVLYALSILGYLRSRDPEATEVRVTASRPGAVPERAPRVA